jgi:hypothetical protein
VTRGSARIKASKSRVRRAALREEQLVSSNGRGARSFEERLRLGRVVNPLDGQRVLDLGCGMKQAREPRSGANRREVEST